MRSSTKLGPPQFLFSKSNKTSKLRKFLYSEILKFTHLARIVVTCWRELDVLKPIRYPSMSPMKDSIAVNTDICVGVGLFWRYLASLVPPQGPFLSYRDLGRWVVSVVQVGVRTFQPTDEFSFVKGWKALWQKKLKMWDFDMKFKLICR